MVIGAPRTGKKTYVRFLINSLLTDQETESHPLYKHRPRLLQCPSETKLSERDQYSLRICRETKTCDATEKIEFNPTVPVIPSASVDASSAGVGSALPGVWVIDAHLDRPMQSFPSVVSLARYTSPILGPAYEYGSSHILRNSKHSDRHRGLKYKCANCLDYSEYPFHLQDNVKSILIGKCCLIDMRDEFLDAIRILIDTANNLLPRDPLIINFESLTTRYEMRVLVDAMNLIRPTHVVHLSGTIDKEPPTLPITCSYIDKLARQNKMLKRRKNAAFSWRTTAKTLHPHEPHEFCYDYARIPSLYKTFYKRAPVCDMGNEMPIASYFSALWPYYVSDIRLESAMKPYIRSFDSFVVEYGTGLRGILGHGMVALCSVDERSLNHLRRESTKQIFRNRKSSNTCSRGWKVSPSSERTNYLVPHTVHGWAMVRSQDNEKNTLHLLIPECFCSVMDGTVNVLFQPEINQPEHFDYLYYDGKL